MRRLGSVVIVLLALLAALVPAGPVSAKPPKAAASALDPIVFVHGWNGSSSNWNTYRSWFQSDGYAAGQLYAWDYNHQQSNATTAGQLASFIDQVRAQTGAAQVDVVTHSMGGLSSRYFLKNLGGTAEVDDWVSIGGPNHGTDSAYFCFDTSCGEMRPGSAFLTALNSGDETPGTTAYSTFWSSCDETINPDQSVILDGARNTHVGCVGHLAMLSDQPTYAGVRDAIR